MIDNSKLKTKNSKLKRRWYIGGLHFQCAKCGRCCSGPGEGYIWVTKPEIQIIADYLKIPTGQLRQKFLKRVGLRSTIIEHAQSKDCIFLQGKDRRKKCVIYDVRPSQCRSWPFWPGNLVSPTAWNNAASRCGGINRGRFYSVDEIEKIKKPKKWWRKTKQTESF